MNCMDSLFCGDGPFLLAQDNFHKTDNVSRSFLDVH